MMINMLTSFLDQLNLILTNESKVLIYFFIINGLGALIMVADKKRARLKKWRIPERVFFIFAFLGAGIGEMITMFLIRHKTRHLSFVIGIPVITALFYGFLLMVLLRG